MEYNNKMIDMAKKTGGIDKETLSTYVILLSPFAPHIAEELWQVLGHDTSVFAAKWPEHDEDAMKDDEVEVPVQINGKPVQSSVSRLTFPKKMQSQRKRSRC